MDLEDYADEKVGVAIAASAVVFSPAVRRAVRRGMVFGAAGLLAASDAVTGFVRGVRRGIAENGQSAAGGDDEADVGDNGQAEPATRRSAAAPQSGRRRGGPSAGGRT
jgi:hypothetical protein